MSVVAISFMCIRLVPVAMAARGAASGYGLLVLAAMGIVGSWGPITSWPALLLSGRSRAPGYAFFNSFAGWSGPATTPLLTHGTISGCTPTEDVSIQHVMRLCCIHALTRSRGRSAQCRLST